MTSNGCGRAKGLALFVLRSPRRLTRLAGPAVLAAGLCAGAGTAAQEGDASDGVSRADREAIASCLASSADSPRACIGAIAVVCSRRGGRDRREAEVACTRREAAVWRERLDAAARILAERLDAGARSRLVSVQRSWDAYVAQKCAFLDEIEPPARAGTMQAGCELREAAIRSLEIERLARIRGQADRPPRFER